MDYLVCDQENAEILQFFTWFCGYVARFSELSPQEILLSPSWKPASRDGRNGGGGGSNSSSSENKPTVHTHRRGGSDRLEQILEIMDRRNARDALNKVADQGHKKVHSDPLNFSTPRRFSGTQCSQLPLGPGQTGNPSADSADETETARRTSMDPFHTPPPPLFFSRRGAWLALQLRLTWSHTGAQQPCRQEVDQIVRQYIRGDAPRRLKISDDDLADCLDAVKHTTHPSAFLSAFTACETILKSRAHPTFIRKSQRNANKPRLILLRTLATLVLLLGFGLSMLFLMGPFPKFYRVVSLLFWWPSLTVLLVSFKGICLFLYLRNLRQLRPWEECYARQSREQDAEDDEADDETFSVAEVKTHISSNNDRRRDKYTTRDTAPRPSTRASLRSATNTTPITNYSMTMQTFGGANKWECNAKWEGWRRRSTARRVWDDCVRVESRAVRLLQDRTVLLAVCVGGAVSSLLTVGSLWLPGGH